MKISLLIVDDDPAFTDPLCQFIHRLGFEPRVVRTLRQAKESFSRQLPAVVLLDLQLPDGNGLSLIPFIREKDPSISIVILSGHGSIRAAVEAMKLGAEDFITKPVDPDHLKVVLKRIVERRQLSDRVVLLEMEKAADQEILLGKSPRMQQVLETCRIAARSTAPILLLGETGTGKQVLARYIHGLSPRSKRPFVYINCAGLSEELLESDLFGHERGAFTGAYRLKKGRAELANGGTLFLDEIAEMPPPVQAKVLHFLEYGEFTRLGGTAPQRADVRIICATNRNLKERVEQGTFREDLYYRIHVLPIEVPPLRERREDIELFIDFFLEKFAREASRPGLSIDPAARQSLVNYSWPGNIRELRNAIERAVLLAKGNVLRETDFPFLAAKEEPQEAELLRPRPLRRALSEFKRELIRRTLSQTGGNQTRAARILGIQRTYLNKLVSELKEPFEEHQKFQDERAVSQ